LEVLLGETAEGPRREGGDMMPAKKAAKKAAKKTAKKK
jgi:hypothetical protein